MNSRRLILGMFALSFVLFGAGCSKLVKVKGTVTLDGEPVQGATVLFEPLDGAGLPANAQTDENGVFQLGTHTRMDGAYAGEYKVTLTPPMAIPKVNSYKDISFGELMSQYFAGREELRKNPPKTLAFPPEVMEMSKTPLRQRVPGDDLVAIELASSGSQPTRIYSRKFTGVDPYGKPPQKR